MLSRSHPPTAAALSPSLIAGRYRIEQVLGTGGVGEVLLVTDVSSHRKLALKRLRADASFDLQRLFEREYQTLASLKHPHTVRVFDYGRDERTAFYTMELLEGGDLRARAPMPWRDACAALRDAALALGVLHARGRVHRDVSPRNLWRMPDGRVKLIDFGAVIEFGRAAQLIGTPPLVPPEALYRHPLDQRADLYALGAVGYYLLTGRNAHPARELADLPELWQRAPLQPSAAVAELARADLEPVPAELDALLLGLLQQNPLARPGSTGELIDRIDTLLGHTAGTRIDSPELHLANGAFVGRTRERVRLRQLLQAATQGQGRSVVIEAEAGMGRSRLLHELGLEARVADVCVLQVDAANYAGMYGVASALALKLLDALPGTARAAAQPYAATLAHVSPALRERLGAVPDKPPEGAGELRVRIQTALVDWMLALASGQSLALLVDGLELTDDGSSAFLLRLAHSCASTRLLLACTLLSSPERQPKVAERALWNASRRVRLAALSEAETLALLQSVFGRPEHLVRLASGLQQTARGVPGHVLELVAQLVRSEAIRFTNGSWVLPQDLRASLVPRSEQQVLESRLARLGDPARALARVLSVHTGSFSQALCLALGGDAQPTAEALERLIEHEVLIRDATGLCFSQEPLRLLLLGELAPEPKQRAQRTLGNYLLAQPDCTTLERLRAGALLLESGDPRALGVVNAAVTHITLHEPDRLAPATAVIEHVLALCRAARHPEHEYFALLAALGVAGYFVDRKYAVAYGDDALRALQAVFGLERATRLRPWLGRGLALIVALVAVSVVFWARRKSSPAPSLLDALTLLFMTVSALAASSGLCYDYPSTQRAAAVLEPFGAFGSRYAPGFAYEVCCGLATAVRDTFGESHARWQRVVSMLESKQTIVGLPDALRARYLSGLLFAMAIMDSQRDDDRSLRVAERLDKTAVALYPMSTDQLRAMYYAHQGDAERYAQYREHAEQRAIQQGAIWQNETWTLLVETIVSLRHHDAMSMKRVAEQLRSASKLIPTLSVFADRSHGAYLLLRGRASEALPWLEKCLAEATRANFGWGRSHGVLARAYNELGRYADARAACARVLGEFSAGDLAFPGLTLLLESEALVAEAGAGKPEEAQRGLLRLLALHQPNQGPLTIAELHEAGVRIALLAGDSAQARVHCDAMAKHYEGTGIPSLIQYCSVLRARTHVNLHGAPPVSWRVPGGSESEVSIASSVSDAFAGSESLLLDDLLNLALRVLAAQQPTTSAHLYWVKADNCTLAASLDSAALDLRVEHWMQARVSEEVADTTTIVQRETEPCNNSDCDTLRLGALSYRLLLLPALADKTQPLLAVAVIASRGASPARQDAQVLKAIAQQLELALARARA